MVDLLQTGWCETMTFRLRFSSTVCATGLFVVPTGCGRPQVQTASCDCSIFPPADRACDTQCGVTTGYVTEVNENSIVVSTPASPGYPAQTRTIRGLDPAQLKNIRLSSRVAVRFQGPTSRVELKPIEEHTPTNPGTVRRKPVPPAPRVK